MKETEKIKEDASRKKIKLPRVKALSNSAKMKVIAGGAQSQLHSITISINCG